VIQEGWKDMICRRKVNEEEERGELRNSRDRARLSELEQRASLPRNPGRLFNESLSRVMQGA
jgi:hypothetical protein